MARSLSSLAALLAGSLLLSSAGLAASPLKEDRVLGALRQAGVVILVRHSATDPGVGDPPGFKLSDCATQRNLNAEGRQQARRLGQWFASHGIVPTSVRASPWCRTRETATLAFGRSQDWVALSNLIGDRSRQDEHASQVQAAIRGVAKDGVDVLVSHGVSISAFVDVYLQQGEMVIVRPASAPGPDGGRPGVEIVARMLVP